MIPKTIHYCWFGRGEKPPLAKKCIASWHKFCPDYRFIEWNEDNFEIDQYPYAAYCYRNKKWAFLSDFVRLQVVFEHGGIYFDTDVQLIRDPGDLLKYEAFYGYEIPEIIATGLGFGAEKGHITVQAMMEVYNSLLPDENGDYPLTSCPKLNTEALVPFGLRKDGQMQEIAGAVILPVDYLNPYDDPTGRLRVTDNTYSIHWYSKSWMKRSTILRSKLTKPFHRVFGVDVFKGIKDKIKE